jgi:hypothetical protein
MSMRNLSIATGILALAIGAGAAVAEGPRLGKPITQSDNGKGGRAVRLIGGPPKASLDGGKTIANYWPYATTLFDFIRRAMPFTQPRSLSDQEVYALTAYLLAENKLIGENDEINATTLPKVRMPNRDNFVIQFPDRI